jgi:hypothetical protein
MFVWQFVDSGARVSAQYATARAPREFPGLPRPVGTSKSWVVARKVAMRLISLASANNPRTSLRLS